MNPIFVINIGNSNTSYGVYHRDGVRDVQSLPTSAVSSDIVPAGMHVVIASVVPEKLDIFLGFSPFTINHKNKLPIDFSGVDIESMGADRIANFAALAEFAEFPAVCIDCGTAVTFEAVDKDGACTGGIIAPGRKLWRKSLHDYTALLPYLDDYATEEPDILTGNTTESSMTVGCDAGILGMVEGLVSRFRKSLGADCRFFVTGGDAEFFLSNIPGLIPGGADFTLRGIAAVYRYNQY